MRRSWRFGSTGAGNWERAEYGSARISVSPVGLMSCRRLDTTSGAVSPYEPSTSELQGQGWTQTFHLSAPCALTDRI